MPKNSIKVSNENKQGMLFGPNFPQNSLWGWSSKNLAPDSASALPRYYMCQFSGNTDNFDFFFAPICFKRILALEFQKSKGGFGICT